MNKQVKRSLQLAVESSQENILTFSCASSTPYLRYDDEFTYYEVLQISENAINFQRLVDGKAPFLFEHDVTKQIRSC